MSPLARYRWPMLVWLSLLFCWAVATRHARADEVYTFVVRKQEEKKKTRWSLQEWLDTRDRMRLMDLWLALHSPSPYEFYLGSDYRGLEGPGLAQENSWRFTGAAYASIFGLEGQWQSGGRPEWLGLFNLRIFGLNHQNTNITLQGGVRGRRAELARGPSRGAVAGVSVTTYFTRFFGIEGLWRRTFRPATGTGSVGNRYEGGAFIDFSFLRVYGAYGTETEAGSNTNGYQIGARFYF